MSDFKDRGKYKDGISLTYSQRVTRRYGVNTTFVQQISSLLDIYKLNFVNNLSYILKYTGLSLRSYHSIMKSYGIRGSDRYISSIQKGECLGFDMYFAAALAGFFKLPVSLIVGINILDSRIDLSEYGVHRNCYIRRVPKGGVSEKVLSEPRVSFFIRKSITRAADKRAKRPSRIIDAFSLLNNTAGERSPK